MKRLMTFSMLCLFVVLTAYGQCDECKMPKDDVNDYCFANESFPGMCAQFGEGASYFKLRGEKKFKTIPIGSVNDLSYLKNIATNNKLKVSNLELLFLIEGLKVWEVEKRKYGYKYEQSGLGIKIIKEGSGELPDNGKEVEVHYSGYLEDGTKFDSSLDRDKTFKFILGQGRVIKGWEEGIAKLKKGTVAWLRIPPELGYGSRSAGIIPPNSTLYFKIEMQ